MLLQTLNGFVPLSAVMEIEVSPEDRYYALTADGGRHQCMESAVEALLPTVPALPGFELLRPCETEFFREPIIAWRVDTFGATAVTPSGADDGLSYVLCPDGQVLHGSEILPSEAAAWRYYLASEESSVERVLVPVG